MRYVIGIDLGTTNSCVSYVDTEHPTQAIQFFRIPQLTSPGYIEDLPTLPSFCYLAAQHEWPSESLNLPWQTNSAFFVGSFAQEQGAKVPTRLVQSAKSWLCHTAANRRDKILPFECSDPAQRISPIEASTRYLRHIREAWNHLMAQGNHSAEFEEQEIILTVPASFDEVARTLTVEAAKQAGFGKMTLLEEPQAAFYSWISAHEKSWEKNLKSGDSILVCDVGGGTTDFSLMEVVSKDEKLSIQRMAVGDHLLLGGDNMDAALTHYLENKLRKEGLKSELTSMQWLQLRHHARNAKESLLAPMPKDEIYKVLLQGAGSGVIQGSMSVELHKDEVESLLHDGFFGQYDWENALQLNKARGLRSMGLPYEDDPSIIKHLACFLNQSSQPIKEPDYVLFNGGALKSPIFQQSIVQALKQWFPKKVPQVLPSISLDLAVARGATYYGKVRRGLGVRIGGGTARSYYLGIDVEKSDGSIVHKALTLLPRGSEEGCIYDAAQDFWLVPNMPVSFQLYTSHVRLNDQSGSIIDIDENEMQPLPPIHTVLRFGKQQMLEKSPSKIPVHLSIGMTAIGTLELWLKSQKTEHKWFLEFQLRSASGQDDSLAALGKERSDETFDADYLNRTKQALQEIFKGNSKVAPKQIMEHLETLLERPRKEWPISVLRSLADVLLQQSMHRKASPDLEARWWNLAGFLLRPGFGAPLDDFRLKELWKLILGDLKTPKPLETQIQHWICYRRIAGGLNKGQQTQLASEIWPILINKKTGKLEIKDKGDLYPYMEKIRVLGALELVDTQTKVKFGNALLERLASKDICDADYWALGRLGARHLLYGSAANIVPSDVCTRWVNVLLQTQEVPNEQAAFAIIQLARQTDQRELNLPREIVEKVSQFFLSHEKLNNLEHLLSSDSHLSQREQELAFGDRLPAGLTLLNM